MPAEIRTLTDVEIDPWIRAVRLGFLQGSTDADVEARRPEITTDRALGAFDGDRVVGTLRSFTTDLVVPGGSRVVTSALTNVTVSPTHRRQGLLTTMITRDLNESKQRGEVLSTLIAAEYPIYGRFGYGPAVASVELLIEASARFRAPADDGTVELVEPASMREQLPPVYETARSSWPGAVLRSARWWDVELGLLAFPGRDNRYPRFMAVSRDPDGHLDGFVTYTTEDIWERNRPVGILRVEDLTASTTPPSLASGGTASRSIGSTKCGPSIAASTSCSPGCWSTPDWPSKIAEATGSGSACWTQRPPWPVDAISATAR